MPKKPPAMFRNTSKHTGIVECLTPLGHMRFVFSQRGIWEAYERHDAEPTRPEFLAAFPKFVPQPYAWSFLRSVRIDVKKPGGRALYQAAGF